MPDDPLVQALTGQRPAVDDPQYREKMAEYHRNLKLRDLPNEMGHIGESAFQQFTDPRQLKSTGPGLVPAWLRLLTTLQGQVINGGGQK